MKCINCGKETRDYTYRRKSIGGNKYCSEKCHRDYWDKIRKNPTSEKQCLICGKDFNPRSSLNKFCSYQCASTSELQKRSKKNGTKKCQQCGKEFNPYTSLDKFCSANCRVKNQKSKRTRNWTPEQIERRLGDKNPGFRNGNYIRGKKKITIGERVYLKNVKEKKQALIDNDGFIYCEYCKTNNSLKFEGHHIIYRSEKPLHPHLHDKENIIILCIKCHNEFHKHKVIRNDIVKQRGLNKLFTISI
jgi:predicted nucleic acid-binding Zn ribbon protein